MANDQTKSTVSAASKPPRRRGRPAGSGASKDANSVQSLDRALALVDAVSQSDGGATLSVLAARTGLAPSTAHRLLRTLEMRRFVQHDIDSGIWTVGVGAFTAGTAFLQTRDVVATARPFMRTLMEASGESVNLGVQDGAEVVFLAQVECREVMRVLARPGGRAPIHCSGMGKALLGAITDEAERERILAQAPLHRYTNKTRAEVDSLVADARQVQLEGYAFDDEEYAPGLRCVAAPIFDEHGEPVAAISLSGPSARLTDGRLPVLGAQVRNAALEVTRAMGGRIPAMMQMQGAADD
ncbi:MAG: helix-turn-helix domain-containing protein [Alphaproteobacteria bacterium]|nr:helix-turn-helix domain-containing protein [Alphaproteobacteria bacterium]